MKTILSKPLVLSRPMAGETLYLYLAISAEAVSTDEQNRKCTVLPK